LTLLFFSDIHRKDSIANLVPQEEHKMSAPAKSLFIFAFYLVGLGLALLLIPNAIIRVFGYPETHEVWIHVVGMLVLFLAFYCFQAVRKEWTDFFRWTVYPRSSVIVFFTAFVLLGLAPPVLILFGVIDLLCAIWTALALRASRASR
jgi:hypothetical protein